MIIMSVWFVSSSVDSTTESASDIAIYKESIVLGVYDIG